MSRYEKHLHFGVPVAGMPDNVKQYDFILFQHPIGFKRYFQYGRVLRSSWMHPATAVGMIGNRMRQNR